MTNHFFFPFFPFLPLGPPSPSSPAAEAASLSLLFPSPVIMSVNFLNSSY